MGKSTDYTYQDDAFTLRSFHDLSPGMTSPHRHGNVELGFVEQGEMDLLVGTEKHRLRSPKAVLFWAAKPHQVLWASSGASGFAVDIPLPWVLRWDLPSALKQALLNGEYLICNDSLQSRIDKLAFRKWHGDYESGDTERYLAMLAEVAARLRRFVGSVTGRTSGSSAKHTDGPAADVVTRIWTVIAEHADEPLTVRDIAEYAGYHPRYAMTQFRRGCGMSIMDYLTRHRIANAQRLLLTTYDTALSIGMQCGFGSSSAFYAAFHKICGMPPDHYRKMLLPEGVPLQDKARSQ